MRYNDIDGMLKRIELCEEYKQPLTALKREKDLLLVFCKHVRDSGAGQLSSMASQIVEGLEKKQ